MRFVNNIKQLSKLNRCNIIEKSINKIMVNCLNSHKEIVLFEKGDYLRGLELFGLNMSSSGVMGVNFENVLFLDDHIKCEYKHNNKDIALLIPQSLCDDEILYLMNLCANK